MRTQVATMKPEPYVVYKVVYDDSEQYNRYRVYKCFYENGSRKQRLVYKYEQLKSAMLFLSQYAE